MKAVDVGVRLKEGEVWRVAARGESFEVLSIRRERLASEGMDFHVVRVQPDAIERALIADGADIFLTIGGEGGVTPSITLSVAMPSIPPLDDDLTEAMEQELRSSLEKVIDATRVE